MAYGTLLSLGTITAAIYLPFGPILEGLLLFAFGFFISSFMLSFTMISTISGTAMAATAVGFMNAFNALIGALSDPIAGKILDMNWDGVIRDGAPIFSLEAYQIAFMTIPLSLLASLLILLCIKETRHHDIIPSSLT